MAASLGLKMRRSGGRAVWDERSAREAVVKLHRSLGLGEWYPSVPQFRANGLIYLREFSPAGTPRWLRRLA